MIILITLIHIFVCFFLIIVVLLQSGKSGRGAATALSRATTWSAIIFMVTSITLSVYASRRSGPKSVLQGVQSSQTKSQPGNRPPQPASPAQQPQK